MRNLMSLVYSIVLFYVHQKEKLKLYFEILDEISTSSSVNGCPSVFSGRWFFEISIDRQIWLRADLICITYLVGENSFAGVSVVVCQLIEVSSSISGSRRRNRDGARKSFKRCRFLIIRGCLRVTRVFYICYLISILGCFLLNWKQRPTISDLS